MTRSFRDRDTESVFEGHCPARWRFIRTAADVTDLRSPPGNRLEELGGDRKGQYSIRVNDPWRL